MQNAHIKNEDIPDITKDRMLTSAEVGALWGISERAVEGRWQRGNFPVAPREHGQGKPRRWASADLRLHFETGKPVDRRAAGKRGVR